MPPRLANPDSLEVLQSWLHQARLEIHTALPARIDRYDAAAGTVDVTPLLRVQVPQSDGSNGMEDLPRIYNVPVCFPRATRWALTFSLAPGETVMLVFGESDVSRWWAQGSADVMSPGDLARHSLAHAMAVPGLFPRASTLQNPAPAAAVGDATSALVLGDDQGTRLTIRGDGTLEVTQGGQAVVTVDRDGTVHLGGASADRFVALAELVDANFQALATAIAAAPVVAQDGGAALKTGLASWQPQTTAAIKTRAT